MAKGQFDQQNQVQVEQRYISDWFILARTLVHVRRDNHLRSRTPLESMTDRKTISPLEEDDDDGMDEHTTQAFERQYLDERSWENLVERDGRLVSVQAATVYRKRVRADTIDSRVRRGMIR